jgi:acyl dehydratase
MTTIADLQQRVGEELGASRWFVMDQVRIRQFAELTEDRQAIHIDPVAAAATAFGGPIAHGFLSLSLLSAMLSDVLPPLTDRAVLINYGFDKVRFVSPVRAGSRIRGRVKLAESTARANGDQLNRYSVTIEIENEPRPALIADWLTIERPSRAY